MIIKTKLDIEDECYFLFNNKVNNGFIKDIEISVLKEKTYIKYSIVNNDENKPGTKLYLEEFVFKTKQELLHSL